MKCLCGLLSASLLILTCGCHQNVEVAQGEGLPPAGQQQEAGSENWATDAWNSAVSSGSEAVDTTGDWISQLYQAAVDQGTTSAKSVQEWVTDDWNAQGDWQYRIVSLPSSDVEAIETALNEAGTNRWNCYHVDTSGADWTFFLKRSRRSYLARVPLRDLINVVPALSGDDGGGDGQ